MKRIVFCFALCFLSLNHLLGQDSDQSNATVKDYLVATYGFEQAEQKLLWIQNYEVETGRHILIDVNYRSLMQKWQSRLNVESDAELKDQIRKRMSLFVPFSHVEPFIR